MTINNGGWLYKQSIPREMLTEVKCVTARGEKLYFGSLGKFSVRLGAKKIARQL